MSNTNFKKEELKHDSILHICCVCNKDLTGFVYHNHIKNKSYCMNCFKKIKGVL